MRFNICAWQSKKFLIRLRAERARYVGLNSRSSAKHEEAKRWLPGGGYSELDFLGSVSNLCFEGRRIEDRGRGR